MGQEARSVLKLWFETGDKPTTAQFASLIDSFFNLQEDLLQINQVENLADILDGIGGGSGQNIAIVTSLPATGVSGIVYLLNNNGSLSIHIYSGGQWLQMLGDVDNTSDLDKPISNATQAALDALEAMIDQMGGGSGTDEKVAATSQGTPGYLDAVLALGDFLDNAGDSEQIMIIGKQATAAEVKGRSTNKRILAPYQVPEFSAKGRPMPALGSSERGGGVKIWRIAQADQELFQTELDFDTLQEISSADLGVKFAVNYNGISRQLTTDGLAYVLSLFNALYTVQSTPNQIGASVDPLEVELKVFKPDGTQITNLTTAQFSLVAINGYCNNATFSGSGSSITAALSLLPGAPDGVYGQEYGAAVINWNDGAGHYGEVVVKIMWDQNGGIGVDYDIIFGASSYPDPQTITKNTIVFMKNSGARVYYFDDAQKEVCYEDLTSSGGVCVNVNNPVSQS